MAGTKHRVEKRKSRRKWKKPGEPLSEAEEAAVYAALFVSLRDRITKATAVDPVTGCFCLHGPVLLHGRTPLGAIIMNPYPGVPKNGKMGKRLPNNYAIARIAMAMVTNLFPAQFPGHWSLRGLKPTCWNPTCWNPMHYDFTGLIPDHELAPLLAAYQWKVFSFGTYVDVADEAYLDAIGKTGQEALMESSLGSSETREE